MKYVGILFSFVIISAPLAFAQPQNFTPGQIELPDRCYSPTQIGTARVIDPDANTDSEKIETVQISVWSDRDLEKRTPMATETGTNTGVFEASIFFRVTDEAASQRIRAFEGDTIYAQYYDLTLPFSTSDEYTIIDAAIMGRVQPDSWWGENWTDMLLQNNVKIVYDPCMAEFMNKIGKDDPRFDLIDIEYPSPLKQFKSGILFNEIVCKEDHHLMLKPTEFPIPVCVTQSTFAELIKRGWGMTHRI
ncbi:hypothetical protein [Nitrosopumilus ureiphilus]|uniref:Uncharacterized protein n=1 Tax=Nitrosopumilus ureiphilus TaxID=1470067 RepID=A0A7D5R1D0_9ARCH|nr:hypothetical protein [Nitrosopumilus ureiphilus]QLH06496.1 hypothetical protein C5F50_04980 [Nitrosopumilus ureiphilus]